jgi:hypothetical protein
MAPARSAQNRSAKRLGVPDDHSLQNVAHTLRTTAVRIGRDQPDVPVPGLARRGPDEQQDRLHHLRLISARAEVSRSPRRAWSARTCPLRASGGEPPPTQRVLPRWPSPPWSGDPGACVGLPGITARVGRVRSHAHHVASADSWRGHRVWRGPYDDPATPRGWPSCWRAATTRPPGLSLTLIQARWGGARIGCGPTGVPARSQSGQGVT